jgi:tellurite resistance protein TerA
MELTYGANAKLADLRFNLTHTIPAAVDVSVFLLQPNGKVTDDSNMVFYGQPKDSNDCVRLKQGVIEIDLSKAASCVEKITVAGTVDSGNFSEIPAFQLNTPEHSLDFTPAGRSEAALIFAEIYRRNGIWKIRCVGQGFNGGLKPLAESYGVTVDSASSESTTRTQPLATKINVSKINLTKEQPKINLEKVAGSIGTIKANLNWVRGGSGFFGCGNIDLDLGAYIEFVNGERAVVQALGDHFVIEPYIKLMGDDRSGTSSDGEWIMVNGNEIQNVKRIMFYAFIYDGAANWAKANALFTLHIPDMPPIETRLDEGRNSKTFCCVAELRVNNKLVTANRINQYFSGHEECDSAFNWQLSWKAGSK